MKIASLEYLIVLAESHSINEAAQKLYIAQSSLTKALQCMERELGFQLFVRSKEGIRLTEAGRQILPEARMMLENYRRWLTLGKGRVLHSLNVYSHVSFPNFLLPDVLLKFKQLHPELTVNCTSSAAPELYISRSTENPAVAIFPYAHGEKYQRLIKQQGNRPVVLFQGEYTCLVNRNNPLAQKKGIFIKDLQECYLVLPEIDIPQGHTNLLTPLLDGIINTCQSHRVLQVESVSSVIDMVSRSSEAYALSYSPALYRYESVAQKKLVSIPFLDVNTRSDYCVFYSRQAYDEYPLLKEFIQAIQMEANQFLAQCPPDQRLHTSM